MFFYLLGSILSIATISHTVHATEASDETRSNTLTAEDLNQILSHEAYIEQPANILKTLNNSSPDLEAARIHAKAALEARNAHKK